jgi:hypothetical protein
MIEIIPSLLTPAMLALSPMKTEAPVISYDWQSQKALVESGEAAENAEEMQFGNRATWRKSMSYEGGRFTSDDWEAD